MTSAVVVVVVVRWWWLVAAAAAAFLLLCTAGGRGAYCFAPPPAATTTTTTTTTTTARRRRRRRASSSLRTSGSINTTHGSTSSSTPLASAATAQTNTTTTTTTSSSCATIDLGTVEEARILFSYNDDDDCQQHVVDMGEVDMGGVTTEQQQQQQQQPCWSSLEDTIRHYLSTSLRRDGFANTTSDVEVTIRNDGGAGGRVYAQITGEEDAAPALYAAALPPFLRAGRLAHRASLKLQAEGLWSSNSNSNNWTFCLPHGLAMTRHHTVQLLHFPPDYVLDNDRDYLASRTLQCWAELLAANGVSDEDETARFQNIIDIVPIAAPSGDGRRFGGGADGGVYGYYREYLRTLLRLWVQRNPDNNSANDSAAAAAAPRPIVAFGYPVRKWIQSEFGLNDDEFGVLGLAALELSADLRAVPVLAIHHPSFLYNLARRLASDDDDDDDPAENEKNERTAVLMRITQQSLVAARWQVTMGWNPESDPRAVLQQCQRHWADPARRRQICELTCRQAPIGDEEDDPGGAAAARRRCAAITDWERFGPLTDAALIGAAAEPDDRIGQRLERLLSFK